VSKTEESPQVSIGKMLNIYRELAIALNSFPEGTALSIKDLAEKAQVHYNTAKKALLFFYWIDPLIPKFKMQGRSFKVVSKPNALEVVEGLFESLEMRVLTKMMLLEATDADRARKLDDILTEEEKSILPRLIERGYVNSIEGLFFLSQRGQALGSMGLSQIVKLNIPLPWENKARPRRREAVPLDYVWRSPREAHLTLLRHRLFGGVWTTGFRRYQKSMRVFHRRKERRFLIATQ